MKFTKAFIAAVVASTAAGHRESPLARELEFAEHAVSTQLLQDHAPVALQKEEAALLKKAEGTIGDKLRGHAASFLAAGAESRSATAQALAAKVTHEIDFASHAVEVQLKQDHAPAALIEEEKDLLAKALSAARDGQSMTKNIAGLEHREHAVEQKLKGTRSVSTAAAGVTLKSLGSAFQGLVKDDSARVKQTQDIESQTNKLLQQAHLDKSIQSRVGDLLATVEREEKNELKSVQNTQASQKDLEAVFAKSSKHNTAASTKTKSASEMLSTVSTAETLVLKDDVMNLVTVHSLEGQADQALKDMKASPKTQHKVAELLSSLESATSAMVTTDEASLKDTGRLAVRAHARNKEQTGEKSVLSLQKENSDLRATNSALKREHEVLVHKEKLAENNVALAKENADLRAENQQLKQQLSAA